MTGMTTRQDNWTDYADEITEVSLAELNPSPFNIGREGETGSKISQSARELQQVLIPETPPTVPGFSLTGAYRPAQEVGGDFLQIIPLEDGDTLVILGDADPEKAKAERKKLLAKVKVEKEYRLQLFKELMGKPLDPVPTDAMVQALAAFAIGCFDSTKTEVLASTLGWPKEFFSWQGEEKGALARLMAYSQAELLRIALVGLEAGELTVHEYDIERKNNSGKTPEIGLERVAKLIGVDAGKVRERFEPKEQPAKKAAVKPAKKAAAKKTAAKKGRAK